MKHRPKPTGVERRMMRDRGYADGEAGRPPASREPEYMTSWRRGNEQRAKDEEGK